MIRTFHIATALAAIVLTPVSALAGVSVRFVNPDRYTDAGSLGARSRGATEAEVRTHLQRLGDRLLAPGQSLVIEVLNIDLAGQYEPWRRNFSDVRIMRDVTPPRITLRYVLTERGKRTRSGEEVLTDINYQMNSSARFFGDPYVYEKALLDDWFRRTIASRRPDQRRIF